MLSREERILGELLVTRGIVSRDALERCARARDSSPEGISLVDALVDSGAVERSRAGAIAEEARALDRALAPALPEGGRFGEFRVIREIGRGGMGIVYEAEQESLGRRVALKILPAGAALDERLATRFLREARAAGRLNHPGIVRVITSGREGGVLWFAMELIEGRSLRDEIAGGPLDAGRAARFVAQVARALAHAHDAGLVHRDIKPDNILLGRDGQARLTDFGLVHEILEGSFTLPHHALGTPAYVAPEQAFGEPVDARSDLYSLGAVLYTLLRGEPPYDGSVPSAVLARVVTGPPPPLRAARPDAPPALLAICERAMARRIEERYARAQEMADDLEAFLEGRAVSAALFPASESRGAATTAPHSRSAGIRALLAVCSSALALGLILVAALLPARGPASLRAPESVGSSGDPHRISFELVNDTPVSKVLPSLSRDGSRLVYCAGQEGQRRDVYQQDLPGGRAVCLTCATAGGLVPSLSPDGQSVAFAKDFEGGVRLVLMTLPQRSVRDSVVLSQAPAPGSSQEPFRLSGALAWSPDGREIAVAARWGGDFNPVPTIAPGKLVAVELASGGIRLLRNMDATVPSWSPHGNRIAFASRTAGQGDLWTVSPGDGDLARVTDDAETDWSPVWAAGGSRLMFGSERNGRIGLWRVEMNESTGRALRAPEPLSDTAFAAPFFLAASADGGRLAIVQMSERGRLYRVPIDPGAGTQDGAPAALPRYPAVVHSPDLSPDGRLLVFQALSPQQDIATMPADGSEEPRFLTDDPFHDGSPRWSPDGQRIAFHSDRDGTMAIWTIGSDGSGLERLAGMPDGGAVDPVWSPDGAVIAFSTSGRGAFQSRPGGGASTGPAESLPASGPGEPPFAPWSWSPDGRAIAGTMKGIVAYELAERRYRRLTDSGERPRWMPDGRHLIFTAGRQVRLLDTRSGASRTLYDAAPNDLDPFVGLSPDGRALYASLSSTGTTIWMARIED